MKLHSILFGGSGFPTKPCARHRGHISTIDILVLTFMLPGRSVEVKAPSAELLAQRLAKLREFRWSSYRSYAGYCEGVQWLWRQPLDRLCGGRSQSERRAALREYTEQPFGREPSNGRILCKHWGYVQVNQEGSHTILQTETPSRQRIPVPDHGASARNAE